ncbi:DUF6884 domain-containing protein [Streptomyces griseus]|uniref:DUF6884 domain-containing protein n=1 Tax=Streptomyces griseus TaxID=1911 RepID=UPI0037B04A33
MPKTITLPVPGQIRRHVLKNLKPQTQGERDLLDASRDGAAELEAKGMNSLNTIELHLTNDAIGSALEIARDWLDSDNSNNIMAGKSMLKFELEYEPDDPREIRHEIKMPKSLSVHFAPTYGQKPWADDKSQLVKTDMGRMLWSTTGGRGRVRAETLGALLKVITPWGESHPQPAAARAAKKFSATYTEPYEKTMRLVNGHLGADDEVQALDFMEAVHGRNEAEAAAVPKRLVVVACGGKKSQRPGKIRADERYTGNYFAACLMAAEVMDGATMVLSAKHGLIPLSEEIESYDVTWGGKGSIRLATVKKQVEKLGLTDARVTVLGGERYVKAARQVWADAEAPLKGGIGQQLKQLAGIYEGEALAPDEGPERIYQTKLQEVGYLPSRNSPKARVMWFGGKAGKANPTPGEWTQVEVIYTGEGKYAIHRLGTPEELMTCTLRSLIHWGPLHERKTEIDQAPSEAEAAPAEVEPAAKPVTAPRFYEVPENWLELAEEGNTEAACRYWSRRCEEWRLTGK